MGAGGALTCGSSRSFGALSGAPPLSTTSSDPHIARPSRCPPLGAPNIRIASMCSSIDRKTKCHSGGRGIGDGLGSQRGGSGGVMRSVGGGR